MTFSPPPLRTNDPTVFGRVAVLMGGTSTERAVSLQSGAHVLAALRARHINAESVDGMAGLKDALATRRFDRVFNVLHGHRGGETIMTRLQNVWHGLIAARFDRYHPPP